MRILALVLIKRLDGRAPPYTGANDLAGKHTRLRTDNGTTLYKCVIPETDLSTDDAVVLDNGAT